MVLVRADILARCGKGVERASDDADSRAMSWIVHGNLANALVDVEAALKLSPGQVSTQYLRAWVASGLEKPRAKADLAYFRKVLPGLVE